MALSWVPFGSFGSGWAGVSCHGSRVYIYLWVLGTLNKRKGLRRWVEEMCALVCRVVSARGMTDQIDTASDLDPLGQSRAFCSTLFLPLCSGGYFTYVDHVCTVQEFTFITSNYSSYLCRWTLRPSTCAGGRGGDSRQSI